MDRTRQTPAQALQALTEVAQRLRAGETDLSFRLDALDAMDDPLAPELRALARALQGLMGGRQRQLDALEAERTALEDKLHDRTQALTTANLRLELVLRQDTLTGIPNRYAFNERLRSEFVQLRRHQTGYGVLALDIDHFKRINDTHGHAVGDVVLQQVAQRVQAVLRQSDFLARTGGEEFVALLPHTDLAGTLVVAEKVRRAVADEPLPPVGTVTVSVGVSLATPDDPHADSAVALADERLYEAKRAGRNRVGGPAGSAPPASAGARLSRR